MATPLADIAKLADQAMGGGVPVRGLAATSEFVSRALVRLNDVAPYAARIEITGTGAEEYALASPWVQGQSMVDAVKITDADPSDDEERELDAQAWIVERNSSGADVLRFRDETPDTSDRIKVYARVPHTLGTTSTTLPSADYYALADLAASLKLEAASVAVLSVVPQGTDEDVVDLNATDRADLLTRQATILRKRFEAHFGIGTAAEGADSGASASYVDVDPHTGYPGGRWHTHQKRGTGL